MFITTANVAFHSQAFAGSDGSDQYPGYTEEEKLQIALRHLLKKQIVSMVYVKIRSAFPNALRRIIQEYTKEAGVRIWKGRLPLSAGKPPEI